MLKKWTIPIAVAAMGLAVLAVVLWCATRSSNQASETEEQPPLVTENGLFLNGGKYIPPPYKITVDREGLYINGICVRKGPTMPKKLILIPETDPGPFQWTPELRAKDVVESGFIRNVYDRYLYWEKQYGPAEAFDRVEKYLKQQPQVVKVSHHGDDFIHYQLDNGELRSIGMFKKPRERGNPGHDERVFKEHQQLLKQEAANLHKELSNGRAFILVNGAHMHTSPSRIGELYRILVSDRKVEDKIKDVGELFTPTEAEAIVKTFEDTPVFKERMRTLDLK